MQAAKHRFFKEYDFRASARLLYPYIQTPVGLAQWFADSAQYDKDSGLYNFVWDGADHHATLAVHKLNKMVRFEFVKGEEANQVDDVSFIEFKLDTNDLTNTVFLQITDYTDSTPSEELESLWDGLVHKLKELVGG